MINWKTLKVGETIKFVVDEFDGKLETICVVTEVNDDYAIAEGDGMNLWIDEDTAYQFSR